MTSPDEVHRNVREQLQALRDSVPSLDAARKYLEMFDEFVREHEFGLALETFCDFLLDDMTAPVSQSVLESVACLHDWMEVRDNCVDRLKVKTTVGRDPQV